MILYAVEIICSLAGLWTFGWLMRAPHTGTPVKVPRLAANGILPTVSSSPNDFVGYV